MVSRPTGTAPKGASTRESGKTMLVFFGWSFISSWHCFAPRDVVDDRGRASHVGHRDAVCPRSVEERLRRLVIDIQVLRGECRRACLMRSSTSLPAAPKVSNRRGRTGMLRLASMMPAALQSAFKLSYLNCLNFSPASAAWGGFVAASVAPRGCVIITSYAVTVP